MNFVLRLFTSALLIREIRIFLRSKKAFGALLLFQSALLLIVYQNWAGFAAQFQPGGNTIFASRSLFAAITEGHLYFLTIITPLLMAPAIAAEQEQSTLTLLLSSPISNAQLVIAKWLTPILFLILLLTASIPFLSIPFLGEGLSASEVVVAYIILLSTTLMFGSLGLFCSTLRSRVYEVYLITVIMTLAVGFVLPYHSALWHYIQTLNWRSAASSVWGFENFSPFHAFHSEMYPSADPKSFISFTLSLFGGGAVRVTWSLILFVTASVSLTVMFLYLAMWRMRYIVYGEGSVVLSGSGQLFEDEPRSRKDEIDSDHKPVRSDEDELIDEDALDLDAGLYLERRVQWFARWPVLFRLTYISLMLSALTLPLASYKGSGLFLSLPFIVAAFFTLPLAATSISSDRERGTLDLLLTSLISTKKLIKAKFVANMQYSSMIALALFVPGMLIQMIFGLLLKYNVDLILQWSDLPAYLFYLVMLGAALMMYTALGLFCSAYFSRTNQSMLTAGVLIFVTLVLPFMIPAQTLTTISSAFGYLVVIGLLFLSPLSGISLLFPEGRVSLLTNTTASLRLSGDLSFYFAVFQCVVCVGVAIYLLRKAQAALDRRD
ncbi:MAG: ABC transporter permease subunit [Candidatus Hinthialibacter antarcticus]|nr:ABC transporter permease subunit [Candidatus Hinthialibacter antarcticus]